jgi:hypothetical protein
MQSDEAVPLLNPGNSSYHVVIHAAVTKLVEDAMRLAVQNGGVVTNESYPLVKLLVDIANILDEPACESLCSPMPVVQVGDNIEDWIQRRHALKSSSGSGALALVVGRTGRVRVEEAVESLRATAYRAAGVN